MTAPAVDGLLVENSGGILRVTIDRPDRMNALALAHLRVLGRVLTDAATDPTVRVVVIAGTGKAFSTGADLAAAAAAGGREAPPEEVMDTANAVIRAIVDLPVPVIAQVNGAAAGVGASIAVAADLAYAAESAYLLLAFVNVGLMPDGGATALVAASIGRARAARLALLGERLPSDEAVRQGLVTEVVPDAELAGHVDAVATRLAHGPRRAIELTKRALTSATLDRLDDALAREKSGQSELLGAPDFAEGVAAMLQKRAPRFG
ncbi:enoyl-CoA hydratase [Rhodococcus triatomae]|uniref:Enoyl-CoA hydratase/carnithine racemase n=1 Tax=Rhodococcus triatomae TaxID=300028 RepID=A0A1G8JQK1_9NOCA|nr:enoyl-CoA hydratase-related protein [Rhodococcus triatomae]QNG19661.1 enoyl-CoA hydratase [Rhodococcus triatomae]QNG24424.1 enoyl-CoA hydratase [Rhodococcus triatomae]SDI33381.1 Enoyl-CoA hydratase/carnithine racemase [Rhodococcus triatomae]